MPSVSAAAGFSASSKQNRFTDSRYSSLLDRNGSDLGDCSPEGKLYTSQSQLWDTQLPSKASSFHCRSVNDWPNSKRDTAQIIALFSSKKKTDPELFSGESLDEQGQFIAAESRASNFSGNEIMNTCIQSKSIPGCKSKCDGVSTDANVAEADQGLFDSFNLSPDSFAASNEEKAADFCHQSSQDNVRYPEGGSVDPLNGDDDPVHIEKSNQEPSFVEDDDSPTEGWSQNDSESFSPLLRQLGSVENRVSLSDHPTCVDPYESRDLATDSSDLDDLSIKLHPEDSVSHRAQQFSLGLRRQASLHHKDSNSVNSLNWKRNVFMTQNIGSDLIQDTTTEDNDVHMAQEKAYDNKEIKEWSIGKQAFFSYPGSLFEYSALESQSVEGDPCQSNAFEENCSSWNMPTEGRLSYDRREGADLQNDFSPEFYPSEIGRASEWTMSATMATKVISDDSRAVSCLSKFNVLQKPKTVTYSTTYKANALLTIQPLVFNV